MKIRIEDGAGFFDIVLIGEDGDYRNARRFHIDQEDTHEQVAEAFSALGFTTEYEEVY